MHGKGGEWGQQPRMNPNRNAKRVEGQRNLLMLPASSSSALSFFMFLVRVKFSQLLRMFHSCCLFVYPPPPILHNFLFVFLTTILRKYSLGQNLYNRKAVAGVLKDVH